MTDRACAICTKRHDVSQFADGSALECHARPPAVDVVFGRFPKVRATDFCHSDFALDASAASAKAARVEDETRLDGLVADTQARARVEELAQPAEPSAPVARRARAAAPAEAAPLTHEEKLVEAQPEPEAPAAPEVPIVAEGPQAASE